MKQYNILYVNNWISCQSGTPTSLLDLVRGLDKGRFRPYALCPSIGPLTKELEKLNVDVLIKESASFCRKDIIRFCCQVPIMAHLLKLYKINLVHVNSGGHRRSYALAAKILGIPLVQHVRNPQTISGIKSNFVFRFAHRIITNSNAMAEVFLQEGNFGHKVTTIYNAVNLDKFHTDETIRDELGYSDDDLVVGIVGRICVLKGTKTFIEMIPKVLKEFGNTKFLIVGCDAPGEEGYTEKMKRYANQLGVSQNITFTGFRTDIPQVMNTLDVLVLASLSEAFGKVIIEAMVAGKCVVATKVGGVPEIIDNRAIGALVPPGDANALADAVIRYLGDEKLRRETGMLAKKSVEERFSLRKVMENIQNLYIELIENAEL